MKTKTPNGLIDREVLLLQAKSLIMQPDFDHQANARANSLLNLADRISPNGGASHGDPELRSFEKGIRSLQVGAKRVQWQPESRDMTEAAPTAGGDFVPAGFHGKVTVAMKTYDRLFDAANVFEAERGGPLALPFIDDTASSATVVGEGSASNAGPDPVPGGVALGVAPTFRSGLVRVSIELLQDSQFPVIDFLAQSFGVRFARGVGAALVTTLLSGSKLGATAAGPSAVTIDDLYNLMASLDPAYLPGGRTYWVMNWQRLISLWKLKDSQNHPIIPPAFDEEGFPRLLGFAVCVSPSWPSVATGHKYVGFGNLGYFVVRTVPKATVLQPFTERYAEYGQVAFESRFRADAGLLCAAGSDAPFKFLENA
jgi:HK97 family phage major capsid protein